MFEHAFETGANLHRTAHVGLEKYKVHEHDFSRFLDERRTGPSDPKTVAPGTPSLSVGKGRDRWSFSLMEPERLSNPAFNVLYVRTQKPTLMRAPLVRMFLDTVEETVELVRPVFRFGIPESSLKDKCKYWREDGSALPMALSMQTQRMLKALTSEQMQERARERMAAKAAARAAHGSEHGEDSHHHHGHGQLFSLPWAQHDHGHGHGHHHAHKPLSPFAAKEEFVEKVTPWVVLGLNVAAWCALSSTSNRPPGV